MRTPGFALATIFPLASLLLAGPVAAQQVLQAGTLNLAPTVTETTALR